MMYAESLVQAKLGALEQRVLQLEETAKPAAPVTPVAVVNVVNERKTKTVFSALATIGIRRAINNGNNNPSGKYLQEFLGLGVREGYWGRELQLATLKQKFRNEEKRVKRQNSSSRVC